MAGWNTTDFNWETLSTFYNAPLGMLLNDLLAAATERWNVFNDTELNHPSIGDNGPRNINAYSSVFFSVLLGFSNRFIRPVAGDSYDYTNASNVLYWDMAELVNEIGTIPDHGFLSSPPGPAFPGYHINAPVTAEWCQWWYHALNKLVRMEYRPGIMSTSLRSGKSYESSDETFAEAKASWAAEPWGSSSPGSGFASQTAKEFTLGNYRLIRNRSITDQATGQWKPYLYTGNYTLSAWAKFSHITGEVYDNIDYPCNKNTYAQLWNDASVQTEVYNKDFEFGYFDTITTSEPENFDNRGWSSSVPRNHCRFDVEEGFEYVAP